jgi:hypothetical protein
MLLDTTPHDTHEPLRGLQHIDAAFSGTSGGKCVTR